MSIFNHEYILCQSVKKSLNNISPAVRIDLSLTYNPIISLEKHNKTAKDTFINHLLAEQVIVIIKDNNEVALTNTDIKLYRSTSDNRISNIAYAKAGNDEINHFLNKYMTKAI